MRGKRAVGAALAAVLLLALALPETAAAQAGPPAIIPHMASYKASLPEAPANVTAEGQIAVSATLRCDRWQFTHADLLAITADGRPLLLMATSQEGEEAADGSRLQYRTQLVLNSQRAQVAGRGTAADDGAPGQVEIEQDGASRTVEMPPRARFVFDAVGHLLGELAAGRKEVALPVYDALVLHKVVEQRYTVVPSPFATPELPSEVQALDAAGLLAGRSWIVKSAMSVAGQRVETVAQIHDSGIASRIRQNVAGITVEYTLDRLQALPRIDC